MDILFFYFPDIRRYEMINNFESEMAISSLLSQKIGYIKKNNYAKRFKKSV